MKPLLQKEFKLGIPYAVYLYYLLTTLLLVPNYPSFVPLAFCFVTIWTLLNIQKSNRDITFTATFPVTKKEIVKSKLIVYSTLELLQIIIAIPFAVIAVLFIYPLAMPNGNPLGMDISFALFGVALLSFSVFNLVFFPLYFKNVYRIGLPMLIAMLAGVAFYVLTEILVQGIPSLTKLFDTTDPSAFGSQAILLAVGICVYVLSLFASYRIAVKNFEKVNL